jgi:hypothetical protein
VKRLTLDNRVEVLPALRGRRVEPVARSRQPGAKLTFDQRATRTRRFPVETSLAGGPEPPWLGRFLDIEV